MEDLALESIVALLDYQFTKDVLEAAMSHEEAANQCWVLVEGELDYRYYNKVLTGKDAFVAQACYVAKDGKVRGGYKIVMSLVEEERKLFPQNTLVGIVDRDYTPYYDPPKEFPDNIFVTDYRDLEMTLLSNDKVKNNFLDALKHESQDDYPLTDMNIAEAEQICRYMGSIHIANAWYDIKAKHEFKSSHYWDQSTHAFLSKSMRENNMLNYYIQCIEKSGCGFNFTQTHLDESNAHFNIACADFADICRGHDWFSILTQAMVHAERYNEDYFADKLLVMSAREDFLTTKLYENLVAWQSSSKFQIV